MPHLWHQSSTKERNNHNGTSNHGNRSMDNLGCHSSTGNHERQQFCQGNLSPTFILEQRDQHVHREWVQHSQLWKGSSMKTNINWVEVVGGLGIIAIGVWLVLMNTERIVDSTLEVM